MRLCQAVILCLAVTVHGYRHDTNRSELASYDSPYVIKDFHRPVFDDIGLDAVDLNFVITTFNRFITWMPVVNNMALPPYVHGSTGTKRWKFVYSKGRWEPLRERGQFRGNECLRCNVTMNEFHRLIYYLPASPAFLLLKRTIVNMNGVEGTPAPVILSRWLYGSEWIMDDFYFSNDSYEGMRSVEISLTALPFNTTRQVEEFLWSLMVQKTVSKLQLAGQLMKTKRVMALIARHRQMTHWDNYWTLDIDEAIDQYMKYGKNVHAEPSHWPVILVIFSMILTTFIGGCFGFFARAHTNRGNIGDGTTSFDDVIRKQRSRFNKRKKALEAAHRTEIEQANTQINELHQSVNELRSSLQQRRVSENNLKQQLQQNGANFEREKKTVRERHLREMEEANAQIQRLQQDISEAEKYSHDLDQCILDAREQVESLIAALRAADDEQRETKRCMDQLTTDYERTSVACANENRQLMQQLSGEQAKVEELTERLRTFTEAGAANVGPNRHLGDEAFTTFQGQVYVTVFANHDGYTSIQQLLTDLHEDHGINGEDIARNYGYDSLADFLRSREMAARISTDNGPNGVVYKGIPNETNSHLREAHQTSSESQAAQIAKLRRFLDKANATATKLRQEINALHEQRRCRICMDRPIDTIFLCGEKDGQKDSCGHVACRDCAEYWRQKEKGCHVCRQPIFKCVKLFQSGTG